MTMRILLAISDPLQRENVKTTVYDSWENPEQPIVIDGAGNIAEAKLKLGEAGTADYDLLICHSHIAPSGKEPVPSARASGLEFLQELSKQEADIPGILITFDKALFNKVQLLDNTGLVVEGEESMDDDLGALTRKYLTRKKKTGKSSEKADTSAPAQQQAKQGKIDIWLKPATELSYYTMEGIGFRFHTSPLPLQIDMEEIDDLIHRSHNVGELKEWKRELTVIGKKILKQLFDNHNDFKEHYRTLLKQVEREENISVRFFVNEDVYPLALEALLDEQGNHLMLFSPIFRTVYEHRRDLCNEVLFVDNIEERRPVSCLIIAANAYGKVSDPEINGGQQILFEPLREVILEAEKLYDFLQDNQREFGIKKVEIVPKRQDLDFDTQIKECLENNQWDLIHYAGHSYFDKQTKKGYLFYPHREGPKPIESDLFSHTLRFRTKTQLIYLSSCESSGSDFVLCLARQLIPSIIGFRWEIDDKQAAKHAELFYRKLFEDKKALPYAFLETRQAMFEEDKDNKIWAAGMLIIQ